jgi:hypothetical protein
MSSPYPTNPSLFLASLIKRTDPSKVYANLQLIPGQAFPSTYYHAANANGEKVASPLLSSFCLFQLFLHFPPFLIVPLFTTQFLIRRLPHEKKKAKVQNIREIAFLAKLEHANLPTFYESYIFGDECWV